MKKLDLVIHNKTGLHARPAKEFVILAKSFQSDIAIQHGEKTVNAKSLISVLTLGVQSGGSVLIEIDGEDELEAAKALEQAVLDGLGEGIASEHEAAEPSASTEDQPVADVVDMSGPSAVAAAPGIAIGPVYKLERAEYVVDAAFADEQSELERFEHAKETAKSQLVALRDRMKSQAPEEALIFDVHIELLEDQAITSKVIERIKTRQSAANAWQSTLADQLKAMQAVDDPLIAERAVDLKDVRDRVLQIMLGVEHSPADDWPDHPVIVLASDLTPSDTASLDKDRVLGFCTALGGPTSHSAILARALGIPAVVSAGEEILSARNGSLCILDGNAGTIIVDPDEAQLADAKSAQSAELARREEAQQAADEAAVTGDGHHVEVSANVGSVDDAVEAYACGADSIGLLRTEFLFLDRTSPPSEEEQFKVYQAIVKAMEGRPVIIRTLDIGGDKPLAYIDVQPEENPFLGERGIRLCLARPDLFEEQIRAIVRASEYGKIRVMFPMVADISEWHSARQLAQDVMDELSATDVEFGIMIEVPSAALMADVFAKEVDFFSIGTNDLTQYTLAMDRTNPALANKSDGLHPAVLRLIERTVEAAHAEGKWVGVCGELGSDPQAVPILMGLGVDELSVAVPRVATVKAQIRTLTLEVSRATSQQALAASSAAEVRRLEAE